jgi:FKBP12-rapamycin complex-associated protein
MRYEIFIKLDYIYTNYRSIVLSQSELRLLWIKFASICRQENKHTVARSVLRSLLEVGEDQPLTNVQIPLDKPQLALSVCKQLWTDGQRRQAFSNLENLTQTMHRLVDRSRQVGMNWCDLC